MWLLNQPLNVLTDVLLTLWGHLSPWVALSVASLLAGGVLVLLFHFSSDQQALLRARNRFIARLLELLLFQHDIRVNLSACGRILWSNLGYLGSMLRPMLVATIPLVLIFIQLACWFEWRPLRVGEAVVLEVELNKSHPVAQTAVEVSLPDTAKLESPAVRTLATNEMAWRLRGTGPGTNPISVRVGDATELKQLAVGTNLSRISPLRIPTGLWGEVLNPGEPPLKSTSPVTRMELTYPQRQLLFGTYEIHWSIAAVILMMIFGLLVGRLFGVKVA